MTNTLGKSMNSKNNTFKKNIVKKSYMRSACIIEKDPEKLKALREERHALEIKANALQKRS